MAPLPRIRRSQAAWLVVTLVAMLAAGCASHRKPAPAPAALDEAALMVKLRADVDAAPAAALSLADQAEQRFGESSAAEERRALAISALINLQRIGSARSRVYDFLRRYPHGPYSAHLAAMTGVHLPPSGPGATAACTQPCDAR